MSLLPSLCAALERAGGERLVMRAGERPHVLAGTRRHDVANAVLSVNAVEALADQILSLDGRQLLRETGAASEPIKAAAFPHPLTARAERVGDDFCVELIVALPEAVPPPAPDPEPAPAPVAHEESVLEDSVEVVEEPFASESVAIAATTPPPVSIVPTPVATEPRVSVEPPRPVEHVHVDHLQPMTVRTRVEEPAPQPPSRRSVDTSNVHAWIGRAMARGATTLYLRAGTPASARIDDRIERLGDDLVDVAVVDEVSGIFGRGGDGVWQTRSDGEWVREYDDYGHVSCRMFSDHQGSGLIVHMRPQPSIRSLHKHIPRQVRTACEGDGLIVVAAPNEAAVEALAWSIADWSGHTRGGYLISLQRRHAVRGNLAGAFVSLRNINGTDADFASAIRRASHEGPDILLVSGPQSELPLHEAILAATAGRLVIVAVVAPTAADALRVMLGQTGLDRDAHVRRALAASFRAAVGYRSVRRIGGGKLLVQDILLASNEVRLLLERADFDGLALTQRQGSAGLRSVDEALARATRRGQISLREAAAHANDRGHLIALVRMLARSRPERTAGSMLSHREIHVPISLAG
jgi:Tfp pilus assembly pilus retraction ATPase PilT